MRAALAAGAAQLILCATATGATPLVHVTVEPRTALLDAPLTIRATGLRPHHTATLSATEDAYPDGKLVAEQAVRADARGVVELRDPLLLGLSRPQSGAPDSAFPYFNRTIVLSLGAGAIELASTHIDRNVDVDDVVIEQKRPKQTGLYGEYYRPRGMRRHAAVLFLGGSEGGVPDGGSAALLAAHGYPVLALAYFRTPGLPRELKRIPLEYFRDAARWFAKRREVDPKRIVLVGVSFGGEATLLLSSTYPDLFRAAAAYVPNSEVTFAPQPLTSNAPGEPSWTLSGKPVRPAPIKVERFRRPIFMVGAAEDHLWASGISVLDIAHRLRAHGQHDFSSLVYPHAGHGVGSMAPNSPTQPLLHDSFGVLDFGGTPVADERARRDSWPKLLRFLARFD